MAGVVQLRKIIQKGHAYTYEVVFIGKLLNIFSVLGDKKLNDVDENALPLIDFSDLNHDYTYQNIVDSWSYNQDYVYPMVDRLQTLSTSQMAEEFTEWRTSDLSLS
jgi:hypothetical protein